MMAHPDVRELESEYIACRERVLAMLNAKFPRVGDPEELYQQAWTEALEWRARGGNVTDFPGLIRLIAWRNARDMLRDIQAVPADPAGRLMEAQLDPAPTPEEYAQVHVDAAVVRRVVDELGTRERAVIKLRFDLGMNSKEIQQVLGVSAKRLEKIVTRAYGAVEQQLTEDSDGESPWSRHQRSLFQACLSGRATDSQVERARRILADDPRARAMFREMRATMDRVAAFLPLPILVDQRREQGIAVLDRLHESFAAVRDSLAHGVGRGGGTSSNLEPAAGGLATLGTAGAAKVALVCMSLGGGAAVCIEAGLLGRDAPAPRAAKAKPKSKPRELQRVAIPVRPVAPRPNTTSTASRPRPTPQVKSSGPPAPSPAPEGSAEFGPGPIGSAPASSTPAAAPSDGGGEFTP